MDVQSAREETIRAYQLHAGVLLAYAHRLTRDDALAQDALQETYLRFFLALVQGERIQSARAWLHRVAHNYVCDFLKTRRSERLCHWRTPEKTSFGTSGACPTPTGRLIGLRRQDSCLLHANGNACNCVLKALTILRLLRNWQFVRARWELCCTGLPRNCASGRERKRDRHENAWQMASTVMETQACCRSWQ